jgi:hypothetical protein
MFRPYNSASKIKDAKILALGQRILHAKIASCRRTSYARGHLNWGRI